MKIGILDPKGKKKNPLTNKEYSETYKNLAKTWSKFPAYENAKKIIDNIKKNDVILVISGTGSGKTVLFPKYLLHAFNYDAKIAITLPKQRITKSAAEFSADTLDVILGEEVGYQYRNAEKNTQSSKTKLLYCTDGTLVARLITDPLLKEFNGAIIDEAHERKVKIDFLLYLLRNVIKARPGFKLIIMSATINQSIFEEYFKDYKYIDMQFGTKTNYPVESIFLDDNLNINKNEYIDVGLKLIRKILKETTDGGIIFFVTSVSETKKICDILNDDHGFKEVNKCIPFYSDMTDSENDNTESSDKTTHKEFIKNGRKIIIATNVAESSLTIDGLSFVIDSGLELKSRYDPVYRVDILEKKIITNAQATQRMGRTGRTGAGKCYHLYTKKTFDDTMERFPAPSIRTESINNELLSLMDDNIPDIGTLKKTLQEFIEPPTETNVDFELNYLKGMDLIDSIEDSGKLTKLGKITVSLQLEPYKALALIMGFMLNCFREVSAIISVTDIIKGSISQLFTVSNDSKNKNLLEKFKKAKKEFNNKYGDHISILKIFFEYEEKRKDIEQLNEWLKLNFLRKDILDKAYKNYQRIKQRYRYKILELKLKKPSNDILKIDIIFRIMASLLYGYKTNILNVSKNKIYLNDKELAKKEIEIDKNSFIEGSVKKDSTLFFHRLHKFGYRRDTAQIVTKISMKSKNILKEYVLINNSEQ